MPILLVLRLAEAKAESSHEWGPKKSNRLDIKIIEEIRHIIDIIIRYIILGPLGFRSFRGFLTLLPKLRM